MCILAFSWQPEQRRLRLFANRDEFYARPTAPAHWWPEQPDIWAGRDIKAGGTWLGVNQTGRFAALTNVRDRAASLDVMNSALRSRGELVSDFLATQLKSEDYLQQVLARGEQYGGFNLLLGDMAQGQLWYGGNRLGVKAQQLAGGIYGLSNAQLDTPWPKVQCLKQYLAMSVQNHHFGAQATITPKDEATALALLSDSQLADEDKLPDTGVALELERQLSAIFIDTPTYGTRAHTLLSMEAELLHIIEQGRGPGGKQLARRETRFCF